MHNSGYCLLVQIFGVLIVLIRPLSAHVKPKPPSKHLSDDWRRANGEKLIEVMLALSLIVRVKKWHTHFVHIVFLFERLVLRLDAAVLRCPDAGDDCWRDDL